MWYFEEDDDEYEEDEEVEFSIIPEIIENDDFSDIGESEYEDSDDEGGDIDF